MKIAMIGAERLPSRAPESIDRQIEDLALRLVRRGHTVFVYVRSETGAQARTWRGVRLYLAPNDLLATLDLLMMPVQVVHFHGAKSARYAWIARLLKPKARIVITLHGEKYSRLALQASDRRIITSHRGQIDLHREAHLSSLFIPPGLDAARSRRTVELADLHLRKLGYLITVSVTRPESGLHYLIQAFRGVKSDKKLVIVDAQRSDPEYSEYLIKLAHDDPRVVFTGSLSGEATKQLLTHTYLYIEAGGEVGVSSVLLEAVSCGAPALVAAVPENMAICNNQCFTFTQGNLLDLRKQLQFAIDNPKIVEARARAGRLFVRKQFGWDRAVRAIENLYR